MEDAQLEYGAITLDTSIFRRYQFHFRKSLLKKLEQFRDSPVCTVVFSEIVCREVLTQLTDNIQDTRKKIDSLVRPSIDYLQVEQENAEIGKTLLYGEGDHKTLASVVFESFYQSVGGKTINVDIGINGQELIDRYFNGRPPFAKSGNKKSEFPDALALLSLEKWAVDHDTKVLVVSQDGDWADFCEQSEWLAIERELGPAISYFQPSHFASVTIDQLSTELPMNGPPVIFLAIQNMLKESIESNIVPVEASGSYYCEGYYGEVTYRQYTYVTGDDGRAILNIIELRDALITIEAKVEIVIDVEASFDFSAKDSIDGDYVTIGTAHATQEEIFRTPILVTLTGSFDEPIEDLTVTDVEILDTLDYIDFGYLEPDMYPGDG